VRCWSPWCRRGPHALQPLPASTRLSAAWIQRHCLILNGVICAASGRRRGPGRDHRLILTGATRVLAYRAGPRADVRTHVDELGLDERHAPSARHFQLAKKRGRASKEKGSGKEKRSGGRASIPLRQESKPDPLAFVTFARRLRHPPRRASDRPHRSEPRANFPPLMRCVAGARYSPSSGIPGEVGAAG